MSGNPHDAPIVLVSGCSSGIGEAIALELASHGHRVLAGVRSVEHADRLRCEGPGTIVPVELDVTSDESVSRVLDEIDAMHPNGIDALVNNAGIGLPSAVELTTPEEFRDLLEVNTVGPLRMIRACLPRLRRRRGRIVNVTSLNGTVALPMVGAYSATKFALEAMSDALRVELRPWGINVVSVAPGQVPTPVFAKARVALVERREAIPATVRPGYDELYRRAAQYNERGARAPTPPGSVASVVRVALSARWPRARYHVGLDSFGMRLFKRLTPTVLFDRLIARRMGTLYPVEAEEPPAGNAAGDSHKT